MFIIVVANGFYRYGDMKCHKRERGDSSFIQNCEVLINYHTKTLFKQELP